jgi:Uma2 family endonuclease
MGAVAATRTGDFNYRDFCALVQDGQKGDLIDGVIYMASPENIEANDLFFWLGTVMRLYARKKKLGRIHGSRVACRLNDKNAPEPDILFVAARHLKRLERGGVKGPPDLAIEIVLPESVERDYKKKRRQYEQFAIPEYWIVDEDIKKVTLLRLDRHGKYREIAPRKGVFRSQALPGFRLDPNWLWQRPRPDELDILQELLDDPS